MIAKNQNFLQNYINAAGAEDAKTTKDVVFSEIANFIYDNPAGIQQLLLKHGVISGQNRTELTDKMSDALSKNKKLAVDLVKMIAMSEEQKDKYLHAGGKFKGLGKGLGKFAKNNPELLTDVASGITNLFGRKRRRLAQESEQSGDTTTAAQQRRDALREKQDAANKIKQIMAARKAKLMPKIFIGAAVALVLLTGTLILINKLKK